MRKLFSLSALLLVLSIPQVLFGQTGPGGVGNATGASGQPQNVLWLRANTGISSSGGLVDAWVDQSGNGNDATGTGATRPSFTAADPNFNGLPSINFPNTAVANFFLRVPDNDNLDNTTALSVLFVTRPTSTTAANHGVLSKRTNAGINQSYVFQLVNFPRFLANTGTSGTYGMTLVNTALNTKSIMSFLMNGASLASRENGNTATQNTGAGPTTLPNSASNLFIGSFDDVGLNNFEGDIVEVIIFRTLLNEAQRGIIENYLSAKYNSPLAAGDLFAGDNSGGSTLDHDFDLAGIGFNGGASHLLANSAGLILSPSAGTVDVNGEFVLAAHNGTANSAVVTNLGTGGVVQRWNRTWYVDRTPATGIDANIAFDFSDGIAGQFPQNKNNYVLLFRNTSTGNYDVVAGITNADKTLVGDQIAFRVSNANLVDGVYTLGTLDATASPVTGASNRTWYSYQSGNWTTPTSWTLDGGLTPLLVNPSNETPGITDNVVITSGRTITMNTNTIQINSLEVTGTLDLSASSGHNFVTVSGPGRIKTAGATDNLPTATYTAFADASTGGTLEINGTGIALNQPRSFRNVEINLTNTTDIASLEENYTINGELRILNGLFRFNNNIAVVNRICTVNGNVTVSATGGIRTGTGNARHEFNLNGDFSNDGTAYFTQRVVAITGSEATDGVVDVNMINPIRDQAIACNGVTRFYRIEVNKGTNETYKVTLSASAGNFNLFGFANQDINVAQAAVNANAMGLIYGTVELGANVNVLLNTTGNYSIYEGAALWVNGGAASKTGGAAIVPYGRLRVTSGSLTSLVGSGITTRENGIIQVEGGAVDVGAIRTSIAGAGAVGSYIQSGGTVTVTGTGGINADYAVFSLTYPGNVFNMSGGTLIVRNRPTDLGTGNLRGSIFINSDPPNVSVTGGTVIADINSAVAYKITSRAPFWNLVLRNSLDVTLRDIELLGTTSGTGGGAGEPTLTAQNLVVKGGLTIESNSRLDHNGRNLNIAGNLTINQNADLIFDQVLANGRRNTTTFDGTDNATLSFLNRDNLNGEQRFWNLVINKPADKIVSLASGKTDLTGNNNNLLRIDGTSFKLLAGTLDQGFHSVRMFCDTVLNYQTVGVFSGAITGDGTIANDRNDMIKLRDDNTPTTFLTTSNAVFGVVRLNSGDDPIALRSNLRIQFLQYLYGKVNLGIYNLTIDRMVGALTGAALPPDNNNADSLGLQNRRFSVEDMLVTSGGNSDGGLSLYIPAGTPNGTRFVFPLGIGTSANDGANTVGTDKYTPAYVTVSNVTDDGYITINPVNTALDLLNAFPNNMMQYYWNVKHSGFTAAPNVRLQFTYNDADDNNGTVTNYVPGRVTGFSTRTADAGGTAAVRESLRQIDFTTGVLTTGLYTAGEPAAFTGSIQVFFNREAATNWNDLNKWSTIGFNGAVAAEFPGPGDVVRLRNSDGSGSQNSWVTLNINTSVAAIVFDNTGGGWRNRVSINSGQTVSLGIVEGEGEIFISANGGVIANVTDSDFGDFAAQVNSFFIYNAQDDNTYSMLANISTYPNLRIEGSNGGGNNGLRVLRNTIPVTVNQDVWVDWGGTLRAEQSMIILRDLRPGAGGGGGGRFQFGQNASHVVTVGRNITSTNSANNIIQVVNSTPSSRVHRLKIGGSITLTTGQLDLFNGTGTANNAILELNTTTIGTFTSPSLNIPDLYRITVNKGTSIVSTFTLSDPVILNGPFDGVTTTSKPLELLNGLLVLSDAALDFTLTSGGSNFSIPGSSGIEVNAGAIRTTTTSTNASVLLDGLLRVSGGIVSINGGGATDTNFIEYSNSGNSAIEVTNGSLTVAGKIRRSLTSLTGILSYTQSGGSVLIANESGTGSDDRGVFEIVNPGSQFNHSGGSFTIVQGINSTTIPSVLIEPSTSSITSGSTITIGNGSTPTGATSQNIGIKSTVPLYNLTIAGVNNPVAKIYVSPLTVANNLIVGSGTTLDANNQNLTIGGNFTVDGSYVPTSNTTFFTNTVGAVISGATPLFNFFNFSKSGAGVLTVSKDFTVNRDLSVLAGTLATSSFAINLKRNALVDATITSSSGSGLTFNGSGQQQLTRSVNGTSSLGIISVNNSAGVVIPDGNGYTFGLTGGLRLQQGVFDIGGSLLNLATTALITPVSPFSATNMIQTNSSFTDQGVRKQFTAGSTADFTFPVGQLAYTPVIFNFSSPTFQTGGTAPTITVRPANETHPAIVDDDELPAGPGPEDFDDLQNALRYHWIINVDNAAATFRSTMTLQYDQSAVQVTAPRMESDYIPARILSDANPTGLINKFTVTDLDETLNTIVFNFSGVTDAGISGQYFAGVDLAIPDNVPVYRTTGSGNVNTAIYTPVVPGGGVPRGATVIVQTGHTLTLNALAGSVSFYETQIEAGATLTISTGSIGHRLGTISGTGNLRIEVNIGSSTPLPAAVYDDFFSCAGGGLIFAGTGTYDILGGITSLRNLTLEGTGTKNLPSNDVTICNNLTITTGGLTNTNSRTITVLNDVLLNGGTFTNNGGVLAVSRDVVQAGGIFNGGNGGAKTIGRDLTISAGTFTPGSGGTNIVTINRNMTVAGAATISTGTSGATGQRFRFAGSGVQTLTGDFTLTRAFNRLEISNGAGLVLAGNASIVSELLLTTGNITPGVNTLLLGASSIATPAEGKATSFVNGKLFKALAAGTITPNSTNSFTFPIGSGARWRSGSVSVANGSSAATWDMQYFLGNADTQEASVTNMTPIGPVVRLASGEYWKVSDGSVTATGRTATLGLSWGIESDVSTSNVERQDLRVMQWVGAPTNQWQNRGGINFNAGNTQSRGTFNASSVISFSEQIVTLGSVDAQNPLPVSLVKFEGQLDGSVGILNWETASEINNDYFEVQRSSDGNEFVELGKVIGRGTTNLTSLYGFEDRTLLKGNNYYRLKQFDFDGKSSYSNVIILNYDGATPLSVFVYPNPTSSQNVNLELINPTTESVTIRILDMTGRASFFSTISAEELKSTIAIKAEDMKSGIYVVEVVQGTQRIVKRLVIQN